MKNKQSILLNSFIKIAKEKKLIKEEPVKLLDLKVSNNLMDNMLKLCNGLRAKGFNSYADELESNYLLYSAASNSYESDGAKKLINEAHPDGSLEYKDVDGEAIFHTVLDTQVKMLDVVSKTPKVKNAKLIQEVKQVFGQLTENLYDQKNVTNVVDTLLQGGSGNLIKNVSNTLQNLTPEQKEILQRRQPTAPTTAPKPENKPGVDPSTYRQTSEKEKTQVSSGVNASPGAVNPVKRFVSYANPDVKKMQSAILNFADIASKTDVTSLQGNQQGRLEGNQSRALGNEEKTINDKEYLGGSDPFGNFILNNYIPKNSYTGKQYLNVDVVGNANREHASMMPQGLRGIIDSMKRVGTPGSSGTEKSIDGIWKTRTNNALHVIGDLVEAMLNFTNDMKKPVKGYSQQELDQYKKLVPNSYTDIKPDNLGERAQDLTSHIEKMTQFFQNLRPTIFENAQLRQYIDQKSSFSKYNFLPDDDKLFKRNISVNIGGKQINISLNDLKNKEQFKSLIKTYFGELDPSTETNVLKYVLSELKKQLDTQANLSNERK